MLSDLVDSMLVDAAAEYTKPSQSTTPPTTTASVPLAHDPLKVKGDEAEHNRDAAIAQLFDLHIRWVHRLAQASHNGDLDEVRSLLADPAPTEVGGIRMQLGVDGHTTFYVGDAVKDIVVHAADLTATDLEGRAALHVCSNRGHLPVVEFLLEHAKSSGLGAVPINQRQTNTTGYVPLHSAIIGGHLAVVKLLLAHGADAEIKDHDLGYTALQLAAHNQLLDVMSELLAQGSDACCTDVRGMTPLYVASVKGHLEVVQLLLQQPRVEVDHVADTGRTSLHEASLEGHIEVVEHLPCPWGRPDAREH